MARVVDERDGGVMGRVAMGEVRWGVAVAAREVVRPVAAMAEGVMAVAMAVGGREEKMVRVAPVVVKEAVMVEVAVARVVMEVVRAGAEIVE